MSETSSTDETTAEALRIAERWLLTQGWKFTPADVGKRAKEIIDATREPKGETP